MTNKILTTHVGSLPRTPDLLEANKARYNNAISAEEFDKIIVASVDKVVAKQDEIGID